MSARPLLTVVMPVRDPSPQALARCVASFAALAYAARIELLLIHTGPFDAAIVAGSGGAFHSLRIMECEEKGIYRAYNAGIEAATGDYLVFFGHDDIVLPGMDAVLSGLERCAPARAVVAADVWMEGRGIRSPTRCRSLIAFRNWCHQGILYSRDALDGHAYDPAYPVRADHVLNIRLLGDARIAYRRFPVAVAFFSAGGFSSVRPEDPRFDADQASLARDAFGWPVACAIRRILPAVRLMRRLAVATASRISRGRRRTP